MNILFQSPCHYFPTRIVRGIVQIAVVFLCEDSASQWIENKLGIRIDAAIVSAYLNRWYERGAVIAQFPN